MSMITARTRALALSFLISVSLTACFDGDNKLPVPRTATPPVASPATADHSADHSADDSADQ